MCRNIFLKNYRPIFSLAHNILQIPSPKGIKKFVTICATWNVFILRKVHAQGMLPTANGIRIFVSFSNSIAHLLDPRQIKANLTKSPLLSQERLHCKTFAPYDNSVSNFFLCLSLSAKTNRLFFNIEDPTGFKPKKVKHINHYQDK